ncbi:MAG: DUF5680 domain-containing protein [Eubacterium sp.]|nr:DUF5680 domain-containing protein [Eubacterium sp.]
MKEALRKADKSMPYRGPEYYQSGEYTYKCKVVGYKTHSAIVKRIKKIAQLLEDYSKEEHKEYCKTFE